MWVKFIPAIKIKLQKLAEYFFPILFSVFGLKIGTQCNVHNGLSKLNTLAVSPVRINKAIIVLLFDLPLMKWFFAHAHLKNSKFLIIITNQWSISSLKTKGSIILVSGDNKQKRPMDELGISSTIPASFFSN